MDEMKSKVTKQVHKEYKDYINRVIKNGKWYAVDNALKIAFYKEIHVYILNGLVEEAYYAEMIRMNPIIDTLWDRFSKNSISESSDHFLNQLVAFHIHNKERMNAIALSL